MYTSTKENTPKLCRGVVSKRLRVLRNAAYQEQGHWTYQRISEACQIIFYTDPSVSDVRAWLRPRDCVLTSS